MAIGGYLTNKELVHEELPLKLAAMSRCYRAEGSSAQEEKGIYRYLRKYDYVRLKPLKM